MRRGPADIDCELMVIGAGMAGVAAALFAAKRGIDCLLVGVKQGLYFASGLLDLMAVHPIGEGRLWTNPWRAIEALVRDCPKHPYALLDPTDMKTALSDFIAFLGQAGLSYHAEPERNVMIPTALGTLKPTYAVPATMLNGVRAFEEKAECLIVDFHGLKGFSARQIVETMKPAWPGLRSHQVHFPHPSAGQEGFAAGAVELYPEISAGWLENSEARARLAEAVRPHVETAEVIGMPAVLGLRRSEEVFRALEEQLERPLFEIPIMPPAVAGLRLSNLFGEALPRLGVRVLFQHPVLGVDHANGSGFTFEVGHEPARLKVRARAAVLAGGRFLGGGLYADRRRVVEPLFGLPVRQLADRRRWHRKSYLDPRGHPINQFGLETDEYLRPLQADGHPAHARLFAAGSILAHQDWMRMKCGSSLAITTAYAAVQALEQLR